MKKLAYGLFKVIQWLACYVILVVVGFALAVVSCGIVLGFINAIGEQTEKTGRRMQYEYELNH